MVAEAVIEAPRTDKLTEALTLIDEGLSGLQSRELISANEVADLLLDVRTLLSSASLSAASLGGSEPSLTDDTVGLASN
jgi:hypothetical protein